MPLRVAIGVSSFAEKSREPLQLLERAGIEVVPNRLKRRLTEDEIIAQLADCDGLIAGLEPLNRKVQRSAAPRLKAIARVGIGTDNVDFEAAAELGIKVSNTPDAPTVAVAELTVAAMLALLRRLPAMNARMHAGRRCRIGGTVADGLPIILPGACLLVGAVGERIGAALMHVDFGWSAAIRIGTNDGVAICASFVVSESCPAQRKRCNPGRQAELE